MEKCVKFVKTSYCPDCEQKNKTETLQSWKEDKLTLHNQICDWQMELQRQFMSGSFVRETLPAGC